MGNWTVKTLDECARVHMDQISERYYNWFDTEERNKEIFRIIESYQKMVNEVWSKEVKKRKEVIG